MRALPLPVRLPGLRTGIPGAALLIAAAAAWAQTLMFDPRDPALYREPTRASNCRVCGEISSIREVIIQNNRNPVGGQPTGQLAFGAVILLPFGEPGRPEQAYVGGVGTQEMAERLGNTTYEITVRMDTGERQTVHLRDGASYRVGERVTVSGGMLARL
jgi:outer membrane lipoprotein SlyB